jgi:hypothetical protein
MVQEIRYFIINTIQKPIFYKFRSLLTQVLNFKHKI